MENKAPYISVKKGAHTHIAAHIYTVHIFKPSGVWKRPAAGSISIGIDCVKVYRVVATETAKRDA